MRLRRAGVAESPTGRSRLAAGLALSTVGPLALAPVLAPGRGSGTSEVLGVLVVVAYAGHVAVTGWLWTVPDVRLTVRNRPARLIVVPAMLVAVAVGVAVSLPGHLISSLLLGFFVWQFSHFQHQNLGLVKLITNKWEAEPMGKTEERLVMIVGWCGIATLIARPSFLGLAGVNLPIVENGVVVDLAAMVSATCICAAVVGALRNRRPLPVSVSYLVAVLFMAPVFLFHSAQAAVTGIVVAHGLQYLWVVRWRSRQARIADCSAGWLATVAVIVGAVLGGSLLEAMSELHSAQDGVLRALYGAYLGVVMAHFAVDAVLWRRPTRNAVTSHQRGALVPSLAYGRL